MNPTVRPAPPARLGRFRRWMTRLFAVFTLGLAVYHGWVLRQVWRLREHDPHTTAFMQNGLERLQSSNPKARLEHRWVPYEEISAHLKRAVIAATEWIKVPLGRMLIKCAPYE